ncbi:MAG: hypothetical protein ACW97A_11925 [Candidatus Thorarchaeota archaeon]
MQTPYNIFTEFIFNLFTNLSDALIPLGIPFGPLAWFYIVSVVPLFVILLLLVRRGRRGGAGDIPQAIQKIIASTGDVSGGMAGAKKLKFVKTPADNLVFLKVEENAIEQAISAVGYYAGQGDIDESMKDKLIQFYEHRLEAVRSAVSKDEELKEIVDADTAVDKARSDYLRKLAAMSGTAVESDGEEAGPTSVGMPSAVPTDQPPVTTPSASPPSDAAPSAGPPSGAAPSGGPPGGAAPSGGPPGGAAPSGGPPGGAAPSDAAPSGGPPGGAAPSGAAPSGGPPGGATPSGTAPSGEAPSGGAPSGKSSLQSEMLAEMERLKALMGGD